MLNSMKSGVTEKDKNAAANAPEVMGRMVQPHDQAWAGSEPTAKAGTASCIGSDMSIVGKIDCNGPAQVFGRIEGEVRCATALKGLALQEPGTKHDAIRARWSSRALRRECRGVPPSAWQ